jgi:hypothetical protein
VKPFKLGGGKPHKVGLGSANLSLTKDKPATVTLKLPAKAAHLLQAKGSLKTRFVVTLSSAGDATTVAPHVVSLGRPG